MNVVVTRQYVELLVDLNLVQSHTSLIVSHGKKVFFGFHAIVGNFVIIYFLPPHAFLINTSIG